MQAKTQGNGRRLFGMSRIATDEADGLPGFRRHLQPAQGAVIDLPWP